MRLSTKSHNLHLRAALARGDAAAALRHFEAMSAAHPPQGLAPAAPAPTPAPAPAPSTGDAAAIPDDVTETADRSYKERLQDEMGEYSCRERGEK